MADSSARREPVPLDAIAFSREPIPADAPPLVPAIVQDQATGEVLMLAWQSREALAATVQSGEATFWSRSRRSLWKKGETSGHVQQVRSVLVDCDEDAVLLQVDPAGPACHTGERTCFHRALEGTGGAVSNKGGELAPLIELERTLKSRKAAPPEGSYVARLYADDAKRHKKVGEESAELIVASLQGSRAAIVAEAADLLFHMMVLLQGHDVSLAEVASELENRFGAPRRE